MKRSIGLRTHAAFLTAGSAGRIGAMNDQCGWYSAPAAIQRFSSFLLAAVSFLCVFGGGIIVPRRRRKMRSTSSLLSGLPGTMASALMASSR